ncbi:nucleoside monophosphate kinase [candidate division WWE3 bacterium]|uniref:Nucleoside monophosphate kinase n=1 Tax=candidate division WWE3 bacterium TaxID=2053526 RepID=A0A955LGG0_UNCKA|nr:nucleoside monophosphate kinase [candidate division WWE3 bacterium]
MFEIFNTKVENVSETFDLNTPAGRHEYFHQKAAKEIEELKEYLEHNSFVSFWLAKKGAGKGTYSKMFSEIIGEERLAHISVGDVVRHVHASVEDEQAKKALYTYLDENYRGTLSLDEAFDALINRETKTLLPTEFILTLVKREIEQLDGQGIMMDGFPRGMDQISYSLYFREIMNLRHDPDFFVLIDVPDSVLDARVKARVVCPKCQLSRSIKFLLTKDIIYDPETDTYHLICDNPACEGCGEERLVAKEGDDLGIEGIRDRLEADDELIKYALRLRGIPKLTLRNTVPVDQAQSYVDEYEITPEFVFDHNANNEVEISTKPWVVKDSDGSDAYSLMAAPVVLSFIKQMHAQLIGDDTMGV